MQNKNHLKYKLLSGKPVIGTWSIIPSAVSTDVIASAGLDFIIIDSEHGPISFETAQQMVISCESRGVSPVMRIGNIDEADILKAMDIGVHAIQVPNINCKKDVENIINLSKYPPIGNRGFSPFTRAGDYTNENAITHTDLANENTLVAINIEGKEAIENIDEILKLNDLDILFIGLFDLSKALGIPGQTNDPRVMEYLKSLTQKISSTGKWAGTIATTHESIPKFIEMGLKYIVYMVDCEMLKRSYSEVVDIFNNSF
tara:strand:- start:2668 stop:3441 length:774 start_codon:yes stop_codon:yes gene_type:complete